MEFLSFDSQLFGVEVFRTEDATSTERWSRCDLLYVFSRTELPESTLSRFHGHLVDLRRDYRRRLAEPPAFPSSGAEGVSYAVLGESPVDDADRANLHALAVRSGDHCRFRNDPYLPRGLFEAMYHRWMDNCLSGIMAYAVVVARAKESIVGMVTLRETGDDTSSIGLVAVVAQMAGRGVGTALMDAAFHLAAQRGHQYLSAATHGQDPAACRFYERRGFILQGESNVYHLWPKGRLLTAP